MFTGIVKGTGVIKEKTKRGGVVVFSVSSDLLAGADIGESVAIDGVCLTVIEKDKTGASFETVPNTVDSTTLKRLKKQDIVNLEPSLKVSDRFGGHFVSGHVDCVGTIKCLEARQGDAVMKVEVASPRFMEFAVEKGSIAIDGVSLTIAAIDGAEITIYIIPHTMKATTLGSKKTGDEVNVEFDLLGKYVLRRLEEKRESVITEEYLRKKGFI
jgi:riboflavin synthase